MGKERHRQATSPYSYGREDTTPIFINPKGYAELTNLKFRLV
jgi:hypothetical protein